ncbi:HET-domain-containing protein [Lentinus tigrinus ALCF2SS1-7]|uniref:HET-domain-containing protein n=1 Tax=Lentinus tigrinus ALCF2SS1-6 TaxID=1328759 RepID=A0A5C2S3G1_9APHY|nr:HET-domain-containing protein [Lentinus tigrinus ALCF2SS1-6]RPD72309.1 HET-domain-containing protein [Lentinus tigrinus ALCF2SS1-7]
MWVLSTNRAELHFFADPEDIKDGFAALSHVWDKEEQSFQDVRQIQDACAKDGTNPRDVVCEKIRQCCELAESHGYKWVWIDTCCIDKTSSAELSEAINLMFRYYSLALICYGYLRDIPSRAPIPEDGNPVRTPEFLLEDQRMHPSPMTICSSVWFTRGWTLQELIAPRFFLFLSSSWTVLGSRADFAWWVNFTTHIPERVLRLEASHTDYSIAQRMSWFGRRKTTRLEDEAYCLLGLFNIHMPTLYGEGRNAFRRLQEEIMKQSDDTTLFAWRLLGYGSDPNRDYLLSTCLLAPNPSVFVDSAEIVYIPSQSAQCPLRCATGPERRPYDIR